MRQRKLTAQEVRVLGCLLEKEQTTPELYPLTQNAVIAACNQRSSRDPVMELSEADVAAALDALRREALVWRSDGARTERWQHLVERRWGLTRPVKAILTLLLLRGPQTPGELRTRAERLMTFESVEEVERTLAGLAGEDHPLVVELPRLPGKREARWAHTVGEEDPVEAAAAAATAVDSDRPTNRGSALAERVERLEEQVAALERSLSELRQALGA